MKSRVLGSAVLALVVVLASACANTHAPRPGQSSRTTIGTVTQVEHVTLASNAPAGAVVGGTLGAMTSSNNTTRNAVLGAAAGSAVAAGSQGSRAGAIYTVQTANGSTMQVVSDQTQIAVGDCVAIDEVGNTVSIRRVAQTQCTPATN